MNKDNKIVNSTVVEVWMDGKKIEGYDFLVGRTKVEMILLLPDNLTMDMLNTFHLLSEENIKLETKAATDQPTSISVRTQTSNDPAGIVIIPQVMNPKMSWATSLFPMELTRMFKLDWIKPQRVSRSMRL